MKKRLKITHVAPYYPPALGGVENVVKNENLLLTKLGHTVTVVTSNYANTQGTQKLVDTLEETGVERLTSQFKIGSRPVSFQLPFVILKNNPDIIHLHSNKHFFNEVPAFVSGIFQKPFVWNPHAGQFGSTHMGRFYNNSIGRFSAGADVVIADSEFERNLLLKSGLKFKRLEVLPIGINLGEFPSTSKTRKRTDKKIILTVCRISEHKGIEVLIKTAAIVSKKFKDIEFIVVGPDVGYMLQAENLVKEFNIEEIVKFTGAISREKLLDFYHNSDIFFLPSRSEAFGIVYLEAMAAGLPIIASNSLATPEIVRDGKDGLLINTDRSDDFAEVILELLLNDNLAFKLGVSSKKRAQSFSWDITIKKLEKLYMEVLR